MQPRGLSSGLGSGDRFLRQFSAAVAAAPLRQGASDDASSVSQVFFCSLAKACTGEWPLHFASPLIIWCTLAYSQTFLCMANAFYVRVIQFCSSSLHGSSDGAAQVRGLAAYTPTALGASHGLSPR